MRHFLRNLFVKSFGKQIIPGLLVLSLALLSGCGGGGGSGGGAAPIRGIEVVGETGGKATSSDGKASVEIPLNALSGERQITIIQTTVSPPANFGKRISPVYDFGPDGLTFNRPVTITIRYDPVDLSQNVQETDLRLAMESNGRWEILSNSTVDTLKHQITAQTTHFTGFGVVESAKFGFPLLSRGPYKRVITSLFDHNMFTPYREADENDDTLNKKVGAYTGETGEEKWGCDQIGNCSEKNNGYKNENNTNFGPENYLGAGGNTLGFSKQYLQYDGHPGIDYRTKDMTRRCGVEGEVPVFAAANGTVRYPKDISGLVCLGGGVNCAERMHTLEIDHGNGYKTYYLHLSSHPKINNQIASEGEDVLSGQYIACSGDKGVEGHPHLHFEVQKNGVPIDPYGWTGTRKSDPYQPDGIGNSVKLWPHYSEDSKNSIPKLSSETIPDGKMMSSGELFSKDWTVEITENNTLNSSYRLRYLSGALSVNHQDVLPEKGANSQYTFNVPMKAPLRPGKYKEDWEIVNQEDEHLGTLWVLIEVDQNVLPPTTPTATIIFEFGPISSVGTTISFHGTGGASYFWQFGDGTTSTLQSPSHIYTLPNTYAVSLTVTDANGGQGSTSITITVGSVVSDPTLLVTVNGTGSGAISSTLPGINNCRATCSASFQLSRLITLTASASPGSTFIGWSEDCVGSPITGCNLVMNGNQSVTATFETDVFAITATSVGNGSISPASTVIVNQGGSQTFAITPAANNRIVDVLVDGFSVGTVTSFAFSGVTSNHTIHAVFELAGGGGTGDSDGTIATATPLTLPGIPINGTIDPLGDVDFYRFTASAGDRVTIDIDAVVAGSSLDSVLRLFDSSGVEIAFNDDGIGSLDSFIDQVLSPAGDYFIAVSAFSDNSTGTYTLKVASAGGQIGSTLTVNANGGTGSGTAPASLPGSIAA